MDGMQMLLRGSFTEKSKPELKFMNCVEDVK